jgi:dolichol kinase
VPNGSNLKHLEDNATIDYRYEIVRKGIHLFSLSIPAIYFFISRQLALSLLLPITAAFIAVDMARYYIPSVSQWFYRWFGWLLRKHETDIKQKRLNGASNVLISASLCVLIFPKIIAINAFTILIISDTSAALFGRRFGRHRFLAKSLEGSLAFFVTAVIVVLIAPKVNRIPAEYLIGIFSAVIGTVIEALPIRIDDNLSIPLSIGFSLWCLYMLFLPALDLTILM